MRRALLVAGALALLACGSDTKPPKEPSGNNPPTSSKLERPALPRAPSGGLPADLRPPRE